MKTVGYLLLQHGPCSRYLLNIVWNGLKCKKYVYFKLESTIIWMFNICSNSLYNVILLFYLYFLCIFFVDLCPFSFGHCFVCPSIYRFWLPFDIFIPVLFSQEKNCNFRSLGKLYISVAQKTTNIKDVFVLFFYQYLDNINNNKFHSSKNNIFINY